jgi:crossover junction endodeoxyribonuclease RusA
MTAHELRYTLPGRPTSWKRTNRVNGRALTPEGMRQAKAAHALLALQARQEWARQHRAPWPMEGAFALELSAYMPHRGSLPDVDNVAKLVSDSLNGLAYVDDVQVTDLVVRRRIDRENPRLEVLVRRIAEEGA